MCAIFGITGHHEAAAISYLGLHALQHRGQEGAGIISTDGIEPYYHRKKGHVADVFTPSALAKLKGRSAIGHTRYSTTGGNTIANLQPLFMQYVLGWIGIAHNGNLVNAPKLIETLVKRGSIFQTTNDTEVIIHLMATSGKKEMVPALIHALEQVVGAYSLLVMSQKQFVAVRDPYGFRPLVMGRLNGSYVFASETTAFDLIGAEYIREVEPGEIITISLESGSITETKKVFKSAPAKRCIFEHVYFARPDSVVFGSSVHEVRKALGQQLADECPVDRADMVIPIPDSGVPGAIGFAERSKIPFDMGIIRSHYIGRTFIEPQQSIRDLSVKLKLNAVRPLIAGKDIVVIDDSLVRGTTSKKLIQHLRDAGARRVHLRITAPPTAHPCFYGIDTPSKSELLASSHSVKQIETFIGADSLGYLSLEGLLKVATKFSSDGYCHACFSGDYPTTLNV